MSTKCTMYYDKNIHIYQECFDERTIHLEKNVDRIDLTIEISLKEIMGVLRCMDYEKLKKQASITDEKITDYVNKAVEKRIKKDNPFAEMHGSLIYGLVDEPKEKQIEKGLKYFFDKRNYLKKIVDELESASRTWPYHYGLEDLI